MKMEQEILGLRMFTRMSILFVFLLTLRMYDFVPVRVLFMIRIILIPIRLYTLQHHCEHVAQTNRDGYQFGLS